MPAVVNGQTLNGFINGYDTHRVDIVGVGDSNQIKNGSGWDDGYQHAITQQTGKLYGTGVCSWRGNDGNNTGEGHQSSVLGLNQAPSVSSGAPAAQDVYLDKGGGILFPHGYAHVPSGSNYWQGNTHGHVLDAAWPGDVEANLRALYGWVSFDDGSGSFRPAIRRESSPFNTFVSSPAIPTNTGEITPVITELDIDAAVRDFPLSARAVPTFHSAGIPGPVFLLWTRWINRDRASGMAASTLDFRGGAGLRSMAFDLQQLSDQAKRFWADVLLHEQQTERRIVCWINSALNDRNDTNQSVGTDPAPSNTVDGYIDNVRALISAFDGVIALTGADPALSIRYVIAPSHALPESAEPSDGPINDYRRAVEQYTGEDWRVASLDLSQIIDSDTMSLNDYYLTAQDFSHLKADGYRAVADAALAALIQAANERPTTVGDRGGLAARILTGVAA